MFRLLIVALVALMPLTANAQNLSLETVFERACVAPSTEFFMESDANLRAMGFTIYNHPDLTYVQFDHPSGMVGNYSNDPEDYWCWVHHPGGSIERAEQAAPRLLQTYYQHAASRLRPRNALSAWGVPYGSCCDLVIQVDHGSPTDEVGGATMSLLEFFNG